MVTEMFWTGALFATALLLLLEIAAIAVYVRIRGAFTVGPPEPYPLPYESEE